MIVAIGIESFRSIMAECIVKAMLYKSGAIIEMSSSTIETAVELSCFLSCTDGDSFSAVNGLNTTTQGYIRRARLTDDGSQQI